MSDQSELLERFRRGAELIAVVTTGAAGAMLDFQPAPGKWSIRQIVCHLSDSELVGACRFRGVLAEDNPVLARYNQDAWAEKLDYSRRKFSQAIETFRRLRGENYELLSALPEEAFRRTGQHEERGAVTLLRLLEIYAGHAEKHAGQIQNIREAWKQAKAQAGA